MDDELTWNTYAMRIPWIEEDFFDIGFAYNEDSDTFQFQFTRKNLTESEAFVLGYCLKSIGHQFNIENVVEPPDTDG